MKLSIIICTFNRSEQLEQLLEELIVQHRRLRSSDAKEVELILVDNNSFDDTKEIVYRYLESTELSIKFFNETGYGLSRARNLAINKAQGDLLAFVHDSTSLDEDWLREVFKIANTCHEQEIGVYGGRVVPMWQDEFPAWLNLEPPYAINQEVFKGHSYGDEENFYPFVSDFGQANLPSGANVLVRKEIFNNCGNFRIDLGANVGGGFGMHEDFEFFSYLATLKVPMLYIPQCIVFNPISKDKMSLQSMRRWYFNSARAKYWITHTDRMHRKVPKLYGIAYKYQALIPDFARQYFQGAPIYLYLKFIALCFYWLIMQLSFNAKKRNWLSFRISESLGEIEAAKIINEQKQSKKFSFKESLIKKGVLIES